MGAMTAMVIPDNLANYAEAQALFVIGQSAYHWDIRNDADFAPAVW
jgi:hypothetical protein